MILRRLAICSVAFGAAVLIANSFALAQKHVEGGGLGTCAAYSGLPPEDGLRAPPAGGALHARGARRRILD